MSRKGKNFKYEKAYFQVQKHVPMFEYMYQQEFKDVAQAKSISKKQKKNK